MLQWRRHGAHRAACSESDRTAARRADEWNPYIGQIVSPTNQVRMKVTAKLRFNAEDGCIE